MNIFRALIILDWFKWIFEKSGIDYPVMRKILQIKLTMDQRRKPTIFNQNRKKKGREEKDENHFIKSLWLYAFLGLLMVPFIFAGDNFIFQMSIVFGIIMFFVMTSMISDFSFVLLDIRDKNILTAKPISKRTLSAAKAVHVFIYMFILTASISALPLIVGLVKHGILFFTLFLVGIFLMDLFIVVLTALTYFFILKFFDGEKLKDMINYVQIALSIGIALGYQLVGRAFDFIDLKFVFSPKWWQFLVPPVWFAGPFEVVMHHNFDAYFLIFSLLALFVPIISLAAYIKIMPAFERNLQKLSSHSGNNKKSDKNFSITLAKLVCPKQKERVFYRFANLMMKNEREFRLKVYPSLGLSLILPFIIIFNQFQGDSLDPIASGKGYFSIYFSMIMIPAAVMMLKYSGRYKGAWIFKTIPIQDLSLLFSGTVKAFIVKLYLPVYLFLSIIFLILFGIRISFDLIVVLVSSIFLTEICSLLLKDSLPFSESFEAAQQHNGWKMFSFMILIGLMAGLHYASSLIEYGVLIYLVVMLVTTILTWKLAFKVSVRTEKIIAKR